MLNLKEKGKIANIFITILRITVKVMIKTCFNPPFFKLICHGHY